MIRLSVFIFYSTERKQTELSNQGGGGPWNKDDASAGTGRAFHSPAYPASESQYPGKLCVAGGRKMEILGIRIGTAEKSG